MGAGGVLGERFGASRGALRGFWGPLGALRGAFCYVILYTRPTELLPAELWLAELWPAELWLWPAELWPGELY